MTKLKTVKVRTLLDTYNARLADDSIDTDVKATITVMLEEILKMSGQYNGFKNLNIDTKPGDKDYYDRKYFAKSI